MLVGGGVWEERGEEERSSSWAGWLGGGEPCSDRSWSSLGSSDSTVILVCKLDWMVVMRLSEMRRRNSTNPDELVRRRPRGWGLGRRSVAAGRRGAVSSRDPDDKKGSI